MKDKIEATKKMALEIDKALIKCGQIGRVVGGNLNGEYVDFNINFPLQATGRVLVELMISYPAVSWVVSENKITCSNDGQSSGTVANEDTHSLPYTAPEPKRGKTIKLIAVDGITLRRR